MCVGHDHIEAILHEEDRERESENRMWSEKAKYIEIVTAQETQTLTFLCYIVRVSLYNTVPFKWAVSVTVWYLIVHDCSQAHDAHMHIIFLADEAGVLDGFAVRN